jgi:hypothetical protein
MTAVIALNIESTSVARRIVTAVRQASATATISYTTNNYSRPIARTIASGADL